MFCAERRQRDGEAQVGQGYDLVEATRLGHLVFRGQQGNHEHRQAGTGHREGGAREFKECGEKSWLHEPTHRYNASNSTTEFVQGHTFRASREPVCESETQKEKSKGTIPVIAQLKLFLDLQRALSGNPSV